MKRKLRSRLLHKISFIISFMLLAICHTVIAQKNNNERQAIQKVIDQETRSYFEMNYDKWAATWIHDSSAYRMNMSPTEFYKSEGWNNVNQGMKESMQSATRYTEEEMVPYLNKFDYKYYINGNMATVFFKEGKSGKEANDEMRLMIKQNGEWKIVGLTIISTPEYNFRSSVEKLKTFIGKWKVIEGSYKGGSTDSLFKLISLTYSIRESMNGGIEFASEQVYNFSPNSYLQTELEQFIPDNQISKFRYYDISKTSNGITGGTGTADFDSSGKFVVKVMYDDKPAVKLTNIYTLKDNGAIHCEGAYFNTEGKNTQTWSFDLIRM